MPKSLTIIALCALPLGLGACGDAENGSGAHASNGAEILETGTYDNQTTTGRIGTVGQDENSYSGNASVSGGNAADGATTGNAMER